MPSFEVLAAAYSGEPKTTDWGPKRDIALRLKGADGTEHDASWWTKADTPLPAPGSALDGDLEPSNYGMKFKKARSGGGFGGGGGKSPEQQHAIQRQHSQEMALRYATIRAAQKLLPADFSLADLRAVIDWFEKDIDPNSRNAAPGMVKGLPVRNEPERTGAPDTVTPSPDYPAPAPPDPDVPFAA